MQRVRMRTRSGVDLGDGANLGCEEFRKLFGRGIAQITLRFVSECMKLLSTCLVSFHDSS